MAIISFGAPVRFWIDFQCPFHRAPEVIKIMRQQASPESLGDVLESAFPPDFSHIVCRGLAGNVN